MLNILTGSLLVNEQDEPTVVISYEQQFSAEGLTDDSWNNHLLLEEPIGSMLTAKAHVFSDTVSRRGLGVLHPSSASKLANRWQKQSCNSDNCKNRNDTVGQSIDIEWHVCPGGTSVHILHKLQGFMLEIGHAHESFSERIIFASMFNEITNWESRKVQDKGLAQAREVLTYAA